MTTEGVDFSSGRPGGAALVQAGKHFVVRYITGANGKGITKGEIVDYQAHGLDIAIVFESTATRPLTGKAAGITDARSAVARMNLLGIPAIPIYFAADFNATSAQMPVIDEYLRGAASVVGLKRTGIYGSYAVMDHTNVHNTATWFWQTYAWSAGKTYWANHLYQYHNGQIINGAKVDFDRAIRPQFGQWAAGIPDAPPSDIEEPSMIVPQALGHCIVTVPEARIYPNPDSASTPIASTIAKGNTLRFFAAEQGWRYCEMSLGGIKHLAWLRADETDDTAQPLTVIDGPATDCTLVEAKLLQANKKITDAVKVLTA